MSPVYSAVMSLPAAPSGTAWQLVSSDNIDSASADLSTMESNMEATLNLSGGAPSPVLVSGSASALATLTAFGSVNPTSYSVGNTVDLVTANTFSTSLAVVSSAGVLNPDSDTLFVRNKVDSVQITSALGISPAASDVASVLNNAAFFLVSPDASASSSDSGSFSQIEGEMIDFTFIAASELEITKPFPVPPPGSQDVSYFVDVDVTATLRRDTTFDTYELVAVPEPSSVVLMVISMLTLGVRRRG